MVDWAYAANGAPGGDNPMWTFVLPMVLMVAIFYFLLIRPQQRKAKEHKSMLDSLQRGDRVITAEVYENRHSERVRIRHKVIAPHVLHK